MNKEKEYYIPHGSYWPFVGALGVFTFLYSFAKVLNGDNIAYTTLLIGLAIILFITFGWFAAVVKESEEKIYNMQVDKSFRMGISWFIFSEIMFFAGFFGALFYARVMTIPELGGINTSEIYTNPMLWPNFVAEWPLLSPPAPDKYAIPTALVSAGGIPLINTILLLTSGVTITWAHHALKANNRSQLIFGLFLTIALGVVFLGFQGYEYGHAITDLNLKFSSGIYGSTFYILTGFHGFHVTLGALMLIVILMRSVKGHFSKERHYAFEAVAWYWHFVDVVWVLLFIFVYWI